MAENYVAQHASIMVNAPVHQVYSLFTHFNDFPKFMTFVKEVTYYDDRTSHWVAEVVGHHQWDAVNEQWIPDRQVGWHSIKGLENFGKVTFEPMGSSQTKVDVYVNYNPPAGVLGNIGDKMGAGSRFEQTLQHDLQNFAHMVDEAPAGALDPNSSNYLFHADSAAAKGTTTQRQNETMAHEPNIGQKETASRPMMDRDITGTTNERLAKNTTDRPRWRDTDTGTIPVESEETTQPDRTYSDRGVPRPSRDTSDY
ncbi:MAG TPA: SRPBCC family protein [Ktedonobacteraceae bacterium]|nr:SRPBCC family protein [Ktedonobacteraceae bacterium]